MTQAVAFPTAAPTADNRAAIRAPAQTAVYRMKLIRSSRKGTILQYHSRVSNLLIDLSHVRGNLRVHINRPYGVGVKRTVDI